MGKVTEVKNPVEDFHDEEDEFVTEDEETIQETNGRLWFLMPKYIQTRVTKLWNAILMRFRQAFFLGGKVAWIFTTSMLLVGLPILYAYDREKNSLLHEQPLLNMTSSTNQ